MRKVILAILLVVAFVVPCFAADADTVSAEVLLEQIAEGEIADTAEYLLRAGRNSESPVLLAAVAELLKIGEMDLKLEDGEVSADSVYAEAIALANKLNNEELADVIDKQSRIAAASRSSRSSRTYRCSGCNLITTAVVWTGPPSGRCPVYSFGHSWYRM